MEVEAGMDVAWCLTCSKRTHDARSTYCSDACKRADGDPTSQASSSNQAFTSPVPTALFSSPPIKSIERRRSSASPTKLSAVRPRLLAHATTLPPASESAFPSHPHQPAPRDRRAFSFPSAPNSPPMLFPNREKRQSTVLPPFTRRAIMASLTPKSPPLGSVKEDGEVHMKHILAKRLAKSNGDTGGANTPGTAPESVFFSTSESSDDGMEVDVPLPAKQVAHAPPPAPVRSASALGVAPSAHFSTLRSQLSIGRVNSLQTRSTSGSPVAAMVASSASSRSREDIISWAKAINLRDSVEDSEEEEAPRGRPRTRRMSSFARLPVQSNHLEDHIEEEVHNARDTETGSTGLATTPKGRIGSALAGLSGYGMGSMIKALTSVTATPVRPAISHKASTPGHALSIAPLPAPAEVSRVAVVASTMPLDENPPMQYMGGGTPTLSTISFSEVVDPSVVGTHDHVEIVTDDGGMSTSSQGYARHRSSIQFKPVRKASFTPTQPPLPERQQRPTRLRPIASTANAIWNLSSYFSRFAPFSISSVISPYAPFAAAASSDRPSNPSTQHSSMSPVPTLSTDTATPGVTSPLPAARSRPDTPDETPAQALVRSLPMDIVIPPCPAGEGEEAHRQHAERARIRSSRSRARSRSRRRSRSRSPSAGAGRKLCEVYVSPSMPKFDELSKGVVPLPLPVNQEPEADADVSDQEDGGGRGRRRGRGESRRGSEVDTGAEGDRARGRGRDRSVRPI